MHARQFKFFVKQSQNQNKNLVYLEVKSVVSFGVNFLVLVDRFRHKSYVGA